MGRKCRKPFRIFHTKWQSTDFHNFDDKFSIFNIHSFQHYLHLHAALFGPHTDEINSVFDKVVDDLEQWQRSLVKDLASKIVDDIKAKSMPYRHDHWISMPDQNALEPFILSVTAGEMFQVRLPLLSAKMQRISLIRIFCWIHVWAINAAFTSSMALYIERYC